MWLAEVDGAIVEFCDRGPDARQLLLPRSTLAVGVDGQRAAVLTDQGTIVSFELGGLPHTRPAPALPERVEQLAISADGRQIAAVVAQDDPDDHVRVEVWSAGRWTPTYAPDFIVAVTHLRFGPTGCLGYAYLTGQPYSMYGSYGSRMWGVATFDRGGEPYFEHWDTRSHDEEPRVLFSWTAQIMVVVYLNESDAEIEAVARERAELADWQRGPLGGQPPGDDELGSQLIPACTRVELDPDGGVAGLLSSDGELIMFATGSGELASLGRAEAFDLGAPGSVRWATEGEAREIATTELLWAPYLEDARSLALGRDRARGD